MDTWQREGFTITTDKTRLDTNLIYEFLSNSYWAKGRNLKTVIQSINQSFCFGVFEQQKQVGFARVITDYTIFCYMLDVFILPSYQKRGLGKWLVQTILAHPKLAEVKTWMLASKDARGLYERYGFHALDNPERVMVRKRDSSS